MKKIKARFKHNADGVLGAPFHCRADVRGGVLKLHYQERRPHLSEWCRESLAGESRQAPAPGRSWLTVATHKLEASGQRTSAGTVPLAFRPIGQLHCVGGLPKSEPRRNSSGVRAPALHAAIPGWVPSTPDGP